MKSDKLRIAASGLCWYEREDYPHILAVSADAAELPDTYDDWLRQAEQVCRLAEREARRVVRVPCKAEQLVAYCHATGKNVDSHCRAEFAAEGAARAILGQGQGNR